jgi:hypothetical protein
MWEAIISQTSVKFYQTARRNKPEDSHFHIRLRENLKSQITFSFNKQFLNEEKPIIYFSVANSRSVHIPVITVLVTLVVLELNMK